MSSTTPRRLYRSRRHRMLAGVCGGIADYFGLDPNVVRIAFLVSFLIPGPQAVLYLVAWVVMPDEPEV